MSTNGEASPKDVKPEEHSPSSVHVSKNDPTSIQAPAVPGHQEVIDAIWPTIMKEVEGTTSPTNFSLNFLSLRQNDTYGARIDQAS